MVIVQGSTGCIAFPRFAFWPAQISVEWQGSSNFCAAASTGKSDIQSREAAWFGIMQSTPVPMQAFTVDSAATQPTVEQDQKELNCTLIHRLSLQLFYLGSCV